MGLAKLSVALLAVAGGALADMQTIEAKVCVKRESFLFLTMAANREHVSDKTRPWDSYRAPSSSTRTEPSST